MKKPVVLLSCLLAAALAGCDEDTPDPGCTLPAKPQLSPTAPEGVIGFELIRQGESISLDAVFLNGGCADLQINLDSDPLTGRDAEQFTVGDMIPANGVAASRQAIGIPITFTSPNPSPPSTAEGVYLATLSFTSNAEDFPAYELELVAPSAGGTIEDKPILEFFENTVPIEPSAALAEPTALVRFYNLGGRTLKVSDYNLVNSTDFQLLGGTATPEAACIYGKICGQNDGLAEGCCEGGLSCRCLGFGTDGSTCLDVVGDYGQEISCPNGTPDCAPYGWVCDAETKRCKGTSPPPCLGGQADCDAFDPDGAGPLGFTCTNNECLCSQDEDCGDDRDCVGGVCTIPAQVCATVNVTSGQFSILGVQLTESAPSGAYSTTLEVTSNDPDTPVARVEITGSK